MVFDDKVSARKYGRQIRSSWDSATRITLSHAIADHVVNSALFHQADVLLTYVGARKEELDTGPLIKRALQTGKQVLVPLTWAAGRLGWSRLHSITDLERTELGLLEPRRDAQVLAEACVGLCVVPGLLFSATGHRIGFGGGYYDRYLVGHRGPTIGLCPTSCFGHQFPVEPHDMAVDTIITEEGLRECTPRFSAE